MLQNAKSQQIRKCVWTEARVIHGLRVFYGPHFHDGKRLSSPPSLEEVFPPLIGAARRVFGSLKAAMEAAGFPYPPQAPTPWNKQTIVEELRRLHAQGKDISHEAMADRSKGSLMGPALRCFGSWRAAIEAAGIDYACVSRKKEWTQQDVIAGLQQRQRKGKQIGGGAIQKEDIKLWAAAKRHFGSYEAARAAAGFPVEPNPPEWSYSAEQFRDAIRKAHKQGFDLASGKFRHTHKDLFYAARNRLGSWKKAVESAGINYDDVRRAKDWSKAAVVARIKELHKAGADLRAGAIQKSDIPLSGAVQRYFGTLRKAMRAAGLPYPDERTQALSHWTDELVIKTLQEMHRDGYDLRYRHVKERKMLLFYAAKKLFGSYTEAVSQAGIDYWELSQKHLKKSRARRPRAGSDSVNRPRERPQKR